MTTTTPTTQREADERALFDLAARFGRKDKFKFRAPGTMDSHEVECVVMEPADVAAFVRAAIDQSTRQAAPEASAIARDWPEDAAHENGNYQCRCSTCGNTFIGYKRRITCKACAHPAATDQPSAGLTEEKDDGVSATYAWLGRAARSGLPEVEHAARTMMAYYQGAEFPDQPSAGQVDERAAILEEAAEACGAIGAGPCGEEGTRIALECIAAVRALKTRASLTPTAPQAASQQAGVAERIMAAVKRMHDAAYNFNASKFVLGSKEHHAAAREFQAAQDSLIREAIAAPQAATMAACQPSTLTGQPDAAICQPAATTASASLDQQMNAVMAVPDESLDDHLRSIGLDPAECEASGRRALAGAINAVAATASASRDYDCYNCGGKESVHNEGCPAIRAPSPSREVDWQSGYKTGYETGLSDGRAEFTNPAATSPAERAALARAPLPTQQDGAVDVARDAARYRVLRLHVMPGDVRLAMTQLPPKAQTPPDRIDLLCDIEISRTNTTGGSEK